ncbi:MAG: SMI1/KNR4 family protein [Gemmataceae bacterium]|nr:SMI1/KNR4 family protein [Gemmataceae bacterium]MCI0737538.1 SMI1/KNR4 family protein [Gemmataceae bacterium]
MLSPNRIRDTTNNWDDLISAVAKLARTSGQATTDGPPFDIANAPISIEALEKGEQQLGFQLPVLLRRLYTEVGNGGFGPGYGLLSMLPLSSVDRPVPSYYSSLQTACARRQEEWPTGVVPFNNWGSLVLSCLDLKTESADPPILRFEPNMSKADTLDCLKKRPFRGTGLIPESDHLSAWLEDWVSGTEMFNRPYS